MSNRILIAAVLSLLGVVGCTHTDNLSPSVPVQHEASALEAEIAHDHSDVQALREKLAAHRKEQIERLEAYADTGRFPVNLTQPTPSHQLKDASGTYCAVANLVVQDGLGDAIDAESTTNNGLLFGDVKDGELNEWILTSGLTREEVAEIQRPAPYIGKKPIKAAVSKPEQKSQEKEAEAIASLRAHFREVAARIAADSSESLDVATSRIEQSLGQAVASN